MNVADGIQLEYQSLRREILQNDLLCQIMSLTTIVLVSICYALWITGSDAWGGNPGLFLFAPPILYILYQQLLFHKYEGTARIAAYIAVFLESPATGLHWESRLASVRRERPDDLVGIPPLNEVLKIENALLVVSILGPFLMGGLVWKFSGAWIVLAIECAAAFAIAHYRRLVLMAVTGRMASDFEALRKRTTPE